MLTIKFEGNNTSGYRYVLGSVLNQVLLHQSVIGLETKTAMEKYGIVPDIIIGCAGGRAPTIPAKKASPDADFFGIRACF